MNSLYGQGGAELRLTDPTFLLIDPFVTISYNRQFERGAGTIGSYLAFLPTQTLQGATYNPNLDFVKVAVGRDLRSRAALVRHGDRLRAEGAE